MLTKILKAANFLQIKILCAVCSVSVSEPPSSVTILDSMGREVGERAGPYTPGTILTLTCVAVGGTHCHSMLPHSSTRIPKTR